MNLKELSKINDALQEGAEIVNPEDKDYYDGKLMQVGLWWGSGYTLDMYPVYADDPETALNLVVAYIEKNHPQDLENTDKWARNLREELAKDNNLEDEWEAEELPDFYETFMYVDATMEGASEPHYIFSENLRIDDAD